MTQAKTVKCHTSSWPYNVSIPHSEIHVCEKECNQKSYWVQPWYPPFKKLKSSVFIETKVVVNLSWPGDAQFIRRRKNPTWPLFTPSGLKFTNIYFDFIRNTWFIRVSLTIWLHLLLQLTASTWNTHCGPDIGTCDDALNSHIGTYVLARSPLNINSINHNEKSMFKKKL